MFARNGGNSSHEVLGDEGSDDHRPRTRWNPLQLRSVEMNGDENHRHLADGRGFASLGQNLVGQVVSLPYSGHHDGGQECGGQLQHRMFQGASKHKTYSVDVVANSGDYLGKVDQILPLRLLGTTDCHGITVTPLVPLDPDSSDW